MNRVHKYEGQALLKIDNSFTICQMIVTNTQLIIQNEEKNNNIDTSLDVNILFTKMEYSIRWVIKNQLITEMIIASQVKRYQFFPVENSLNTLKPFLDGNIPYRNYSSLYTVEEQLKQMKGGQVLKVVNKMTGQIEVAKQIYTHSNSSPAQHKMIYNEIAVAQYFRNFQHQNLLKLLALFVEKGSIILVFEYIEVTSLYRLINQFPNGLPLEILRKIMKTTLKAIRHMHKHKIMHRDIKMDNILMRDINDPKSIVIIDYGFASTVKSEKQIISKCGTPGYIAPEILDDEEYTELCDIYSVAQVFRILLNGYSQGSQEECPVLSDLLLQMNQDQEFRPSAQECLDHDFFMESKIENKVRRYSQINHFKHPCSSLN